MHIMLEVLQAVSRKSLRAHQLEPQFCKVEHWRILLVGRPNDIDCADHDLVGRELDLDDVYALEGVSKAGLSEVDD